MISLASDPKTSPSVCVGRLVIRMGTPGVPVRNVDDTKDTGTTDFADDTDEKERQISGGGFIPRLGRIQSNLPVFIRFSISGIHVIRGHV